MRLVGTIAPRPLPRTCIHSQCFFQLPCIRPTLTVISLTLSLLDFTSSCRKPQRSLMSFAFAIDNVARAREK